MLFQKPLDDVDLDDIRAYITASGPIRESQFLDFKRCRPDKWKTNENKTAWPAAKLDFLEDVCAFMNSEGGDIIYGVENDGSICGFEFDSKDFDALEQNLNTLVSLYFDPRPSGGLGFKVMKVAADRFLLFLRISPSWSGPHRVTLNNKHHYKQRLGGQNSVMTHQQLLNAISRRSSLDEKVAAFIASQRSGDGVTITVMNLDAFGLGHRVDTNTLFSQRFIGGSSTTTANFFGHYTRDGIGTQIQRNRNGTMVFHSPHILNLFDCDTTIQGVTNALADAAVWWESANLSGEAVVAMSIGGLGGRRCGIDLSRHMELDFTPLRIPKFESSTVETNLPFLKNWQIDLNAAFGRSE